MGYWSTSAPSLPSGASWSGESTSNSNSSNNYNYFREACAIARGPGDTIYVRVKMQLYGKTYGQDGTTALRAEVAVGSGGYEASATYNPKGEYGGWLTKQTLYYTGTAAPGTAVYPRIAWNQNFSGPVYLSAPAYVTTYAVTYDGNGADGGSTAAQSKLYNSDVTLQDNGFTREGYTFVEWNTAADGTGTSYAAGASYSTNAALALYAIWQLNTYAVDYDANGGTGITAAQTKTYGEDLTLRDNAFTYSGHLFSHWNTKADGTGVSYAAGATYTINAEVTLYAIWTDTYAIVYHGNGATSGSTASQTKIKGTPITIQSNGFVRDKHTFIEWNTSPDGTGTSYDEGDTYSADAALTLFAIWLKNNIPVYVNDNGTVRQVEKAYYNDNGVVRECSLYYNDNGTIRPLT